MSGHTQQKIDESRANFERIRPQFEEALKAAKVVTEDVKKVIDRIRKSEVCLLIILNQCSRPDHKYNFKAHISALAEFFQKKWERISYDTMLDAAVRAPSIFIFDYLTITSNIDSLVEFYKDEDLKYEVVLKTALKMPSMFVSKPATLSLKINQLRNGVPELNGDINEALDKIHKGFTASPERIDLCLAYLTYVSTGKMGILTRTVKPIRQEVAKALGYTPDEFGFVAAVRDFNDPLGRAVEKAWKRTTKDAIGHNIRPEEAAEKANNLLARACTFLDLAMSGVFGDLTQDMKIKPETVIATKFIIAPRFLGTEEKPITSYSQQVIIADLGRKSIKTEVSELSAKAAESRRGRVWTLQVARPSEESMIPTGAPGKPKCSDDEVDALLAQFNGLGSQAKTQQNYHKDMISRASRFGASHDR